MVRHSVLLFALILVLNVPASPQQNCPLPPSLQSIPPAENIFSDQQEVDLGDAMAEAVALRVNIIQNDELTTHLRELGDRLIHYLSSTKLNFRFYLIDLPQVNAFSIAGGRVYVSRKIVAFAHNDDELAGVLAHELGHIVTHQSAIEMTRAFREVLSATQVGSRKTFFKHFTKTVKKYCESAIPARAKWKSIRSWQIKFRFTLSPEQVSTCSPSPISGTDLQSCTVKPEAGLRICLDLRRPRSIASAT